MEKTGDFFLQLYATSPAPKRDYHGLTITNKYIVLNSWDISRGSHVYPRRKRFLLEDFVADRHGRNDVGVLFGPHVLDYIEKISRKDKSLYSLSEVLFRKLLQYLAVNDILHLRQTSKIFFQVIKGCAKNHISTP